MKPTPTLLAVSSLLTLLAPTPVKAEDDFLSFDLSPAAWAEPALPSAIAAAEVAEVDPQNQPLPIPPGAANPPMRYHSPQQLPAGVYRRGVAVALNESTSPAQLLPPAPPLPETAMVAVATLGQALPLTPSQPVQPVTAEPPAAPVELLDFALEPSAAVVVARAQAATVVVSSPLPGLFEGNSDSLVAWAVGSAEGTRTPNGAINPAYFGHTDPGNRVWNMGTFSYQHGAKTPEEADQKQLARLQNQGEVLRQRALKHGMNLTLEETLNGLDLANQSPLAAIGRVGYIERLAEAKTNGYEGSEAILVARTRSYINPDTGRWNAPGLGNTEPNIRRDQRRRANAVANAIAAYAGQNHQLQPGGWALAPPPVSAALLAQGDTRPEPVDQVLAMWTTPSDPTPHFDAVALAREPDLEDGAPLAHLWQITVERVAQVALTQGTAASHQIASGMRLFDSSGTLSKLIGEPDQALGEAVTEGGDEVPHAAAEVEAVSAEMADLATPEMPLSQGDTAAIASPTWAAAREGSQSTPPLEAPADLVPAALGAPLAGAFPDSQVYLPTPLPAADQVTESIPLTNSSGEGAEASSNSTVDLTLDLVLPSLELVFPASDPPKPSAPTLDDAAVETANQDFTPMETSTPESREAVAGDAIPSLTAEQEASHL